MKNQILIKNFDQILYKEIEESKLKEYKLGEHDCALFAINILLKLYNVDLGKKLRGKYDSKFSYLKLWKNLGASSLKEITDIIIEKESQGMRKAKKGNLVLFKGNDKNEHLGICIGARVVAISDANKLFYRDILDCECCWRIG